MSDTDYEVAHGIAQIEQPAVFKMNGWAGYSETACIVIGSTPKRYRVRLTHRCRLPGRGRWGYAGEVVLMPKAAVRLESEPKP